MIKETETAEADLQAQPEIITLAFATVDEFVRDYALPHWVHRSADDVSWCARWWEHAEAVSELEALWEAFEVARLQPPPAIHIWFRDSFRGTMASLTRRDGVFHKCQAPNEAQPEIHRVLDPWPSAPAPAGMFMPATN